MGRCQEADSRCKPQFEVLEPRLLLSGEHVPMAGPWLPTGDPAPVLYVAGCLFPRPARIWHVDAGAYEFPRAVGGEIRGGKFHDLDGDGARDDGEPYLRGWTVYVDTDQDGQLDDGEPSAVTDGDGRYVLRGLPPGTHTVAEVNQDGWLQTFPSHGGIERVDVAADGSQADGRSFHSAFSADGRYLAFRSGATNLVPDDTNGKEDLFLADRQTGTIRRISLACDGSQANGDSDWPTISADGRFVAFESDATNLVPGGSSAAKDVYVYDRLTDTIECASMGLGGSPGGGKWPALSANGRYVTFTSRAKNLVPGDTNGEADIFVHDRQTGTTERVSIASDGSQTDRFSYHPEISADGRFVTFYSGATTLVPDDTNGENDVFVYDRQTDTIGRVSLASDGSQGDGDSFSPSISADGRYVAFLSRAANLVAEDTNGGFDIFLHDRQTATTRRVSVASDGSEANGDSHVGVVSGDGRYVAFYSHATNLVPSDTNGEADVFVHDCQTGATRRVSMAFDGSETNEISHQPAISADGRFVAFQSRATNLVPGDINGALDIFVVPTLAAGRPGSHVVSLDPGQVVEDIDFGNRQLLGEIRGSKFHDLDGDGCWDDGETGLEGWTIYLDTDQDGQRDPDEPSTVTDADGDYVLTDLPAGSYAVAEVPQDGWGQTFPQASLSSPECVSLASDGSFASDRNRAPRISTDGRYVAFGSDAPLVPEDTNGLTDVYVRDRETGTLEWLSMATDGSPGSGPSYPGGISAHGRYVTIASFAPELVSGDTNQEWDVFVYDRETGVLERVSLAWDGSQSASGGSDAAISDDGRYVVFTSSSALVPEDTNGESDIFVYDRHTDTIERVSVASDGSQGNGRCHGADISADGRYVSFESSSSNLVPGDTNANSDIFVHDRQTGTTERVSVASDGSQGTKWCMHPDISGNGRYVVFRSISPELVPGVDTSRPQVFVHDRQTRTTQFVSAAFDGGTPYHGVVDPPDINHDGRYVAFSTWATEIVPGDTNGESDVFVWDRLSDTTRRVSMAPGGLQANGWSCYPALSGDGSVVAFVSSASNLVPGDTNEEPDLFVVEIAPSGTHTMVLEAGEAGRDVDFGNRQPPGMICGTKFCDYNGNGQRDPLEPLLRGWTIYADLDHDGQLDDGEPSALTGAYGGYLLVNLPPGTYTVAEVPRDGWQQTYPATSFAASGTHTVALGPGQVAVGVDFGNRYVAGEIHGSKFHDLDGDGCWDDGEPGLEGWTIYVDTDQDGQLDDDEPSAVTDGDGDYALKDLPLGTYTVAEVAEDGWEQTAPRLIERVSVAADGTQGEGRNFRPSISADGRYVAFTSEIASLVPGDTNGHWDIFVRDRQTGDVERVNLASDGSQANGWSQGASISGDGRYVAFMSGAANLVPGDQDIDDNEDIFVYDRQTRTIECASLSLSGVPANHHSRYLSISADGRFVAFQSHANNLVPDDTNGKTDTFVYDRQTGDLERVNVSSDGTQANNHSEMRPAISADGRYVAFLSAASNLVPGDTNDRNDIFVYDRSSGTIERVSMAPDGAQANNHSDEPQISADGRYVAFCSYASNLAAADDNYYADTFIYDRQTGSLQWVSQPPDGSATDNNSYPGGFSADGRFLAFASFASDLIPGDSGVTGDILIYDQTTQTYRRVGTASDGTPGNDHSYYPVISADGRYLAFESEASNLVEGDTNDSKDIFVCTNTLAGAGTHRVVLDAGETVDGIDFGNRQPPGEIRGMKFDDRNGNGQRNYGEPGLEGWTIYVDTDQDGQLDDGEPSTLTDDDGHYVLTGLPSGTYTLAEVPQYGWEQTAPRLIERVSVSPNGTEGDDRSSCPSISADGRYVAFASGASNLVPGDTNGRWDVFVRDRQTGAVERVSLASDGSQGGSGSWRPAISADGRFVAFESCAMNFVPGGWGDDEDTQIFVHDRQTGTIQCASLSLTGRPGSNTSRFPAISADGRYVAYVSCAFDLVPNDTNDENDIFVFDRQTDTIQRVSVASDGTQGDTDSDRPTISADGRYVAFESYAANLVPGDTNDENDVFVRDRQTGTTRRVSVASGGTQGNNDSSRPVISADGRYVAFTSYASNLAPGDTNPWSDVFVHDRQTGALQWASAAPDGSPSNNNSYTGGLSADGRYLTLFSYASNLVPGDSGSVGDVFVYDSQVGTTRRVGVSAEATEGNGNSEYPVISADGRHVAFESRASNLVQGDTNGERDVFVCANTLAGAVGTHRVALDAGRTVQGVDFGNRRIDAPLIVSTTIDENDGDYGPGDLSLREAIALAAGLPGDDVVEFCDSLTGGTILLDAALGQLAIDSNIDVAGPGADRLTVDAGGNCRVFRVGGGAVASIAGLTITGGWAEDPAGGPDAAGGGIYNLGMLTLDAVVISGSYAGGGGGLCNIGTAVLTDVTISGNSAREGGGIANYDPGVMTVTGSVISGNTLDGGIRNYGDLTLRAVTIADNEGGGITNEGPLTVADSTIWGNTTPGAGGGIQNYRYPMTVTNTTISGNSSKYRGGGLYVNGGSALLVNTTLTGNRALSDGGGIFRYDGHGAVVTLHNTIVAGNYRGSQGERSDVAGTLDDASSHNLIGSAGGAARLGPLADNGGPTLTHALLPGSAALDAGSNDRAHDAGLTGDQRGFDRFLDGDGDGVATVDIGAYEARELPGPVLHVEGEVQFDGRRDYLVLEDHPKLNITEYTLAFWFKADSPGDGTQALIARGEDWPSDKAQWIVELNDRASRGKVQLWYEEASDRDHYFPTATTIEADRWYHFAASRSQGGEVTIYLDGQVELQRTDPTDPVSIETPITLGARRNSPHRMQDYFDGTLREAFVYDAVLSADRINELMAQTQPIGEGPVLELPGTTTFDGTEYILVEDSPELNVSEYTVAFWFAADAPDDGTQALIARGEDWAGDKAQWVVELNDRASRGKVQLWYEEANDRDHYFPTQTSIEADTWYHFAATRTADGKVTIYLNGQVELQRTDPADPASVETPITIGARRNSPHNVQDYFDGIIHHVLVYGHALDDARVNEILAETRPECWIGDQTEVSAIGRQADVAVADDAGSIATGQMPDGSREPPELGGLRLPGAGVRLGLRAGRGLPDLPPGMMKRSGDRPDAHAVSVPSSDDAVIIHRQHPCLLRPSARPGRLARHDTRPAAEAAAVGPDCAPILLPRWLRFACRLPSAEVRLHLRATTVPAKAGVGGGDVGAQG